MEQIMNSLKPDPTVHKALISTTSRMVGEYDNDYVYIGHAWPQLNSSTTSRFEESPASRNAYVAAFRTEAYDKKAGIVIPTYGYVGDLLCSHLSVLFGKRFDFHGLTESSGMYATPELNQYNTLCNHRLPINSHKVRKSFCIPLDITHFNLIERLFSDESIDKKFHSTFQSACKFYYQALQAFEKDPETAYLNLITVGELLSGYYKYEKEDLIDGKMQETLTKIRNELENGEKLANQVLSRILSVKRKFVKTICRLIDDDFYISSECELDFGIFTKENFESSIAASYDLRSKYVHTGVSFGGWIEARADLNDLQFGKPVEKDKEYAKILAKAPTLVGLERTMRYCLLSFLSEIEIEIPHEL
tara:strand:- start:350 stop:1432 length:1083 start_codon:yes stop_codon:yes gene_type:complete